MMDDSIINIISSLQNPFRAVDYRANLLDTIAKFFAMILDVERISIMFKDETNSLVIKAAIGLPEDLSKTPDSHRVADIVMQTGEALLVKDIEAELKCRARNNEYNSKSFISVPLKRENETLGLVNVTNKLNGKIFNQEDLQLLSNIVSRLSNVLSGITQLDEGLHIPLLELQHTAAMLDSSDPLASAIIGTSDKIRRVRHTIYEIANTDLTVFIGGETGTGKSMVTKSLHDISGRRGPFVKVNCAALPETLLESELFGYDRGAFTGAYNAKPGRFELANKGTIFLDEIGELHPLMQAKLLQVIEEKEFPRLGGTENIKVDIRIIAVSNCDLVKAVSNGAFRADLFYRLNEASIILPPLRERKEDIPLLTQHFLQHYNVKYKRDQPPLSSTALQYLEMHDWPGNVRELENTIKQVVIFGDENAIHKIISAPEMGLGLAMRQPNAVKAAPDRQQVKTISLKDIGKKAALDAQRKAIKTTLQYTKGNMSQAARLLSVCYKTFLKKMEECNMR
jgi:transcriptional regulator with GAF, ATPase, and Fis domain